MHVYELHEQNKSTLTDTLCVGHFEILINFRCASLPVLDEEAPLVAAQVVAHEASSPVVMVLDHTQVVLVPNDNILRNARDRRI